MQIGFWGAGLMGSGLARNLLRADHEVFVFSRDLSKAEKIVETGKYGKATNCLTDLAVAEVIFTCVARPAYLLDGMVGSDGLYAHMKTGALHIECSTIDPKTAEILACEARQHGIDYLQATLGKTPAKAEKAEEPVFVGGDASVQKRAWSLLETIGKPISVGTIGASCAAKLISNLIGMTNICVLAEGLRIGRAAGMDLSQLLAILEDTGAMSYQMELRGPMIAREEYTDPKFRLTLALKDVTLGTDMAHLWNVSIPLMDAARTQFTIAETQGLRDLDCAAVAEVSSRTFSSREKE